VPTMAANSPPEPSDFASHNRVKVPDWFRYWQVIVDTNPTNSLANRLSVSLHCIKLHTLNAPLKREDRKNRNDCHVGISIFRGGFTSKLKPNFQGRYRGEKWVHNPSTSVIWYSEMSFKTSTYYFWKKKFLHQQNCKLKNVIFCAYWAALFSNCAYGTADFFKSFHLPQKLPLSLNFFLGFLPNFEIFVLVEQHFFVGFFREIFKKFSVLNKIIKNICLTNMRISKGFIFWNLSDAPLKWKFIFIKKIFFNCACWPANKKFFLWKIFWKIDFFSKNPKKSKISIFDFLGKNHLGLKIPEKIYLAQSDAPKPN